MAKYIFVTGGVVSGLGKGICAASLGRLLKQRGLKVTIQKFDPYFNVDPGTMSPFQHGEVFVTDDGAETDLDLGHYERFVDVSLTCHSSVSSGRLYWDVLNRERCGDYLGATVQIIPHITNEIKAHIYALSDDGADVVISERGGTVGDIESQPFLESIRQVANEQGRGNVLFIHVPLIVTIPGSGELKSKPVQHSVKELLSIGIQPDILVCRTDDPIPEEMRPAWKERLTSGKTLPRRSNWPRPARERTSWTPTGGFGMLAVHLRSIGTTLCTWARTGRVTSRSRKMERAFTSSTGKGGSTRAAWPELRVSISRRCGQARTWPWRWLWQTAVSLRNW